MIIEKTIIKDELTKIRLTLIPYNSLENGFMKQKIQKVLKK